MLRNILKSFSTNEQELRSMQKTVQQINALEARFRALSDVELQNTTSEFKSRLARGETLEGLLPEAFAAVREASRRIVGMRHFDVQLMGGIALHRGNIAEMRTGEGKTLVAGLPAYLNALEGRGVHVVTVNEYLSKRDAETMGLIYQYLNLTVGLNLAGMSSEEKRAAYLCDITFGTTSEFGFDYLRDNMVRMLTEKVQRGLSYAIIDEADSVLIDEARTPLIISGTAEPSSELYLAADAFAKSLHENEHYECDRKTKSVFLTEEGIANAEREFAVNNLYDLENARLNHHIGKALSANIIMIKDKDYVEREGDILIVDQFTGRIMEGRRFNDGLHQAIEAKERVEIQRESSTFATVTIQNYFRMYAKLSGMTGTAKTEEEEFKKIYGADVVTIPTNRPVIRNDAEDVIYLTKEEKYEAVAAEIQRRHEKGQPVLVGTADIAVSEFLSEKLRKKGIGHQVLNAKNHQNEALIVERAGERNAVTIATNMAGRGTDIKLGAGISEIGGLAVIGTERHESRRIDNQLRGRSGRQGDPGFSAFYLSLEDDLLKRFGSESLGGLTLKSDFERGEPVAEKWAQKEVERSQKEAEGASFEIRKWLLQLDDVLRRQRDVVYTMRDSFLAQTFSPEMFGELALSVSKKKTAVFTPEGSVPEEWDYQGLTSFARKASGKDIDKEIFWMKERDEIAQTIQSMIVEACDERRKGAEELMSAARQSSMIGAIDEKWMEHIDEMEKMKSGIHLRSYGQIDPHRAYESEGFEMFHRMMEEIKETALWSMMNITVKIDHHIHALA